MTSVYTTLKGYNGYQIYSPENKNMRWIVVRPNGTQDCPFLVDETDAHRWVDADLKQTSERRY